MKIILLTYTLLIFACSSKQEPSQTEKLDTLRVYYSDGEIVKLLSELREAKNKKDSVWHEFNLWDEQINIVNRKLDSIIFTKGDY